MKSACVVARMPKWKTIVDDLVRQSSEYRPGERLCTTAEICSHYSVSHLTAQRVLEVLRTNGHTESIPGRGTFVRHQATPLRMYFVSGSPLQETSVSTVFLRVQRGFLDEAARRRIPLDYLMYHLLPEFSPDSDTRPGFLFLHGPIHENVSRFLHEKQWPYVTMHPGAPLPEGTPSVRVDIKRGGYLATKHLIDLGHKRIALLYDDLSNGFFMPRFLGYKRALREARIPFDWVLVKQASESREAVAAALGNLLALPQRPTAIFAGNDRRALYLVQILREWKIRVPEEMSVIGYNNDQNAVAAQPALTTIDTHMEEVGSQSLALLERLMREEPCGKQMLVVKPDLVVRDSTAAPSS
jgi:DNA-binding LacI/PurR family transcriptional regulator